MNLSPRLVLVAVLLLVLPALVTALFLARQVRWSVAPGAQPGGTIAGRLEAVGAVPADASLAGVAITIVGIPRAVAGRGGAPAESGSADRSQADGASSGSDSSGSDSSGSDLSGSDSAGSDSAGSDSAGSDLSGGAPRQLAAGTTDAEGRFTLDVAPIDGHYEVRASGRAWQSAVAAVSLLDGANDEVLVPVRPAATLELKFARRSGMSVRGGTWTLDGAMNRNWFSAWAGVRIEQSGTFTGTDLAVEGLPPIRVHVDVRLDGGDRTELVIDLVVGPNRHTVEL